MNKNPLPPGTRVRDLQNGLGLGTVVEVFDQFRHAVRFDGYDGYGGGIDYHIRQRHKLDVVATTKEPDPGILLPDDRPPTHPGVILKDLLGDLDITAGSLAQRLSVAPQCVTNIVDGEYLDAHMAWLLARELGTTATFWTNLQTAYSLWHARADLRGQCRLQVDNPLRSV